MPATLQDLFTPIFVILALMILIAGIVGMQFLDKLFAGSKNLQAIRIFALYHIKYHNSTIYSYVI